MNKKQKNSLVYTKIQWTLVLVTYLIDIIWVGLSSSFIHYPTIKTFFSYYSLVFLLFMLYFLYRKFRPDPQILSVLLSACWLITFSVAGIVFSYLAYTTNLPLVTHALASIDNDLGVNPLAIVLWFQKHPWLNTLSFAFYASFLFQKPFVLIYLSLRGKFTNLQRFILQYMIGAFLSIFLGALFPAEGTYAYYPYQPTEVQLADLQGLYDLRHNIVDLRKWNGIITFPSFHVAAACFYIYAFRTEERIIFIPIVILNILLMFSCLVNGGHFFIDILGGVFVGVAVIFIEALLYKWVTRSSLNHTKATESMNQLAT